MASVQERIAKYIMRVSHADIICFNLCLKAVDIKEIVPILFGTFFINVL